MKKWRKWGQILTFDSILTIAAVGIIAASELSDLYMNAATEKYLQGDYMSAVENLEMLLAAEPGNAKAKKFAEKIVIEAATNLNLTHNYKEALKILAKGRKISPENEKIAELEKITENILAPLPVLKKDNPVSEPPRAPVLQEPAAVAAPAVLPAPEALQAGSPVVRARPLVVPARPAEKTRVVEKVNAPPPAAPVNNVIPAVYIAVVFVIILALVSALFFANQNRLKKQISEQKEMIEKNFALVNETIKKSAENTAALSQKSAAPPASAETQKSAVKPFIKKGTARIMELVEKTPELTEEVFMGYPELEEKRERIAHEVLSFYKTSREAAFKFLISLKENPDPAARANAPRALAAIGAEEAIKLLIDMLNDPDEKVKREVLKNLKAMLDRAAKGDLKINEYHFRLAGDALRKVLEDGSWII